jgi:hypothetical protein
LLFALVLPAVMLRVDYSLMAEAGIEIVIKFGATFDDKPFYVSMFNLSIGYWRAPKLPYGLSTEIAMLKSYEFVGLPKVTYG